MPAVPLIRTISIQIWLTGNMHIMGPIWHACSKSKPPMTRRISSILHRALRRYDNLAETRFDRVSARLHLRTPQYRIRFDLQVSIILRKFLQKSVLILWRNQCTKWTPPHLVIDLQTIKRPCSRNEGITRRKNGLNRRERDLLP